MKEKSVKKRTNDGIGKNQYQFDFELEKNIYSYLYGIHKKRHKKLKEELKFRDYSEWKRYVRRKYKGYDSEKLIGFSRYLKQRLSNEKPEQEYLRICIPIVLSIVLANFFEMLTEICNVDSSKNTSVYYLAILVVYVFVILALICTMFSIVAPLWENNTKEDLLMDYKEIVDNLIEEKKKEEKKVKIKKS